MTMKDLYGALCQKTDLHSLPELYDSVLIWRLYPNAYIQASCDGGDATVHVMGDSLVSGSLMHWHPEPDDLVELLYSLGKKGNILVLKKSLLGTSTVYMGPPEQYPLSRKSGLYFGAKKWGGGQLICLEQR